MRYLIISDIHANWEGLQAVLADSEGKYEKICCLGDVVGYGADPNLVTDWVRENCVAVIRGNHDKACSGVEEPDGFNDIARAAVQWTRDELTPENLEYLRELPKGPYEFDGFTMVHGSPMDEDEYVIDVYDAIPQFAFAITNPVFFGHTHVQGGFALTGMGTVFPRRGPLQGGESASFEVVDKELVNPGSAGQPRDAIWEAGYAIYETESRVVTLVRVEYDVLAAQTKIREAGLPSALADRLSFGR